MAKAHYYSALRWQHDARPGNPVPHGIVLEYLDEMELCVCLDLHTKRESHVTNADDVVGRHADDEYQLQAGRGRIDPGRGVDLLRVAGEFVFPQELCA